MKKIKKFSKIHIVFLRQKSWGYIRLQHYACDKCYTIFLFKRSNNEQNGKSNCDKISMKQKYFQLKKTLHAQENNEKECM